MDYQQTKSRLNGTQKTGFVLLLVFGILAVGLGLLQMRNTIFNPFVIKLSDTGSAEQLFADEQTRLQSIDTDHDGLNDWEELNFYETSPYLPDTDSDGISDAKEIKAGTDPLCPEGDICNTSEEIVVNTSTQQLDLTGEIVTPLDVFGQAGIGMPSDANSTELLASLQDAKKLRELLLQTGQITQEQLDQISDSDLLALVDQMLQENLNTTSTQSIVDTSTTN